MQINRFLLVLGTWVGLIPETRGPPAVLSRTLAISIVVLSATNNIFCFALLHGNFGIIGADGLIASASIKDALYFSIVTFTTLGYGDFSQLQQAGYRRHCRRQAVTCIWDLLLAWQSMASGRHSVS